MKCEDLSHLMPDYLQGELPSQQSAVVEKHLAECSECAADAAMWNQLAALPEEQPGPSLKPRFEAMLASYQEGRWEKENLHKERNKFLGLGAIVQWVRTPSLSIAWAAALLIAGFFAGHYFDRGKTSDPQIAGLHQELQSMRQLVVLSMLQQQSASERLQAVSYSLRQPGADPKVLDALLHTLRYDNSVDVRLAALDALSRYGGRSDIRKGLVDALEQQQSPLVQVALIDVLVELHDSNAIAPLKRFQQDPKLDPSVRKRADWGIQQLS
ncbi:MAG TPA: zf-HC2 domain-containing protein [Verrucomicrobiae bacterium]|nr:zf-HC2 domain-containing protein [Verrucomicrobiae bacterium]